MTYLEILQLNNQLHIHKITTGQDIEKQVNEILEAFDFHKVKQTMQALEWKWFFSNTEDQIPSYGELVMQAQNLVYQALQGYFKQPTPRCHSSATGGFHVTLNRCDDSYITVELQFVVSSWDNYQ